MGGKVYETSSFKQAMDSNYYPLESMKKSVDILKNSQNIDIETMEFGQYQPILAPQQINPNGPQNLAAEYGPCPYPVERATQHRAGLQGRSDRPPDKMRAFGRLRSQMLQFGTADLHAGQCYAEGQGRSGSRRCMTSCWSGTMTRRQRTHASEFDDGLSGLLSAGYV